MAFSDDTTGIDSVARPMSATQEEDRYVFTSFSESLKTISFFVLFFVTFMLLKKLIFR